MSAEEIEKLRQHLIILEKDPQNSVKGHLKEVGQKQCDCFLCKFYLVTCDGDEVRESDLITFLVASIIRYVKRRSTYTSSEITNPNYWGKLFIEARDKFIENSRVDSGEVGELLLFVLLESQGIFQIVNKMLLKTAQNMHVHGADVIHVHVQNGEMVLHFGESKMHSDLGDNIGKFIESVENFTDPKTGKERFEIDLISTHIDESKFGDNTEMILDLMDPFAENKNNLRKVNSIFIGYDWDMFSKLKTRDKTVNLFTYLENEHIKSHDTIVERIETALAKSKIAEKKFQIHIVPFKDVATFKDSFRARL